MRDVIQVPGIPTANATYSQAIRAGGFLFVSGQTGVKPETGHLVSDDIAEQARQAMENTAAILRAAGSSLGQVVSVNLYLTDYSALSLVNQIYGEFSLRPAQPNCLAVSPSYTAAQKSRYK